MPPRRTIFWAGVLAYIAAPLQADDIFTGLHEERLLTRLGRSAKSVSLGRDGVEYCFTKRGERRQDPGSIRIGVHPSVAAARESFDFQVQSRSVGPLTWPTDVPGADEVWWAQTPSGENACVIFRERNIIISFEGPCPMAINWMTEILDEIRNDRETAPLGAFPDTPRIESAGFPASLTASVDRRNFNYVPIQPEIRGLGDIGQVRFLVKRGGMLPSADGHVTISLSDFEGKPLGKRRQWAQSPRSGEFLVRDESYSGDGRFIIYAPETTGTVTLTLVAVNDLNVFVTKTIDVNVVAAP
ncbi:hypothetical protein RAS1_40510 [Phycisphaerae bacterium RAS1]|nr:hypothetical protein RAS1_40510 [Phycisphaerae bacterium RAS1]